MDQPTMDGVNTFVVSKAVKEAGVTVALSGLGGDELFAGYSTFRRALRLQEMQRFSKSLRRAGSRVGRTFLNGSVQQQKFWQILQSDGSPRAVYEISRQLFAPDQFMNLLAHFDAKAVSPQRYTENTGDKENGWKDPINTTSLLELNGYMANTLLRDTDFMSMAHSLEVRVPLVDKNVAEFVLGLPGEWKMNGGGSKPLLRDAIKDLLPAGFLERPKMGFTLPFERWMRSRLREDLATVLEDEKLLARAGLHAEAVSKIWRRFLRSPRAVGWSRPWSLYVLAKWCGLNDVTA